MQLSGTIRTLGVSLYKIANDIRLMSCGPRAGCLLTKLTERCDRPLLQHPINV
jgi:fumarate hydratase, class II